MTQEKLITILITNYNTSHFVELLLYSLKKLTKNSYKVLINDNGSKDKDIKNLLAVCRNYPDIFLHFRNSKGESGSLAHGAALDILMNQVDTPYTAVFDSDVVVLQKNWDEFLISQINEKVKITGSPLPKESAIDKPSDFPFQFLVLFETEVFKKMGISWKPDFKGSIPGLNCDTAWELKPKYTKAGYSGWILLAENTRSFKQGPFANLLGVAEYYFKMGEPIFASHFARGSTSGSAKYRRGTLFINRVPYLGRVFRVMRGKKEIKEWIEISRKIIEKQALLFF